MDENGCIHRNDGFQRREGGRTGQWGNEEGRELEVGSRGREKGT
jgi:hypothetical protein